MYVLFPAEEIVLGPHNPSPSSAGRHGPAGRQRPSLCRYHRQLYEQQQRDSQLHSQLHEQQLQRDHAAQDDILAALVQGHRTPYPSTDGAVKL
ncbi:Transcription factor 1 [Frankliniella fusca]|uniref:Transcription factor 1 n=1 Tax=Frankliniella fusca TaxID=407009 RepID=A0AAE1H5W1_9NEOP|nr:Transcription factor 1 [Frankliniella fusca]